MGFGATATEIEIEGVGRDGCRGLNPAWERPVVPNDFVADGAGVFAFQPGAILKGAFAFSSEVVVEAVVVVGAGAAAVVGAAFSTTCGAGAAVGAFALAFPSAASRAMRKCSSSFAFCSAKNAAFSRAARARFSSRFFRISSVMSRASAPYEFVNSATALAAA